MRTLPQQFLRHAGVALLIGILGLAGCTKNGGGMLGGNSSAGDSSDQGSQKPGGNQPKGGGTAANETTEPQNSVTGQPSAASDSGSPSAVAHRSVAQPGAPEGTMTQSPKPTKNPGSKNQPAKAAQPAPVPER